VARETIVEASRIIDLIVDWLSSYCKEARMSGFVLGVSGGIDSAVSSALSARTGESVILLNLPIYQAEYQISLADRHIRWLAGQHRNVSGIAIDLTAPFRSLEETLPEEIQDGLTMANARSRLRMTALYATANHHKMLVVGTGNKIEDFGVGFYTKYGDGGVDISPIADLTKTEVYAIGRELGIDDAILKAPPTDGLWTDNRSDESQIGATYAELEWAMARESKLSEDGKLTERQQRVMSIYRKWHRSNRHKMDPIPVFQVPSGLR